MPPLLERSSDVEREPMLPHSENSAPIDIDLLNLNIYAHHGIQNSLPLMLSKARMTGLSHCPCGDSFEEEKPSSTYSKSQRQYASLLN